MQKPNPSRMTLRIGASSYELEILDNEGARQRFDLSKLSKIQLSGVRELFVNFWCRERGLKELYS